MKGTTAGKYFEQGVVLLMINEISV